MRLFRSEEKLPAGGAVVPMDVLGQLATDWYGDRLDPDWKPRSRDQSQMILRRVGLTEPFWELP